MPRLPRRGMGTRGAVARAPSACAPCLLISGHPPQVKGQPALLYLVPGVLLPLHLRAALRREMSAIWSGTALPSRRPAHHGHGEGAVGDAAGGLDASTGLLLPRRGSGGCCCDYKRM